jgi:MFS family permease
MKMGKHTDGSSGQNITLTTLLLATKYLTLHPPLKVLGMLLTDESRTVDADFVSMHEPLLSLEERAETSFGQHEVRTVDGLPSNTSFLVKSMFFLDALGSSTWGRFSAVYYNLHGLNSRQVGVIEGACSTLPMLSMVAWGIVADRCHSQKRVWLVTKIVSTSILLTMSLPWVYCSFLRILFVALLAQLFVSNGILDAYTLEQLGTENKIYYGRYRLFASLSWGIGSIVMGLVTDHWGFEPNFIMFAILGFLMVVLVATKIPNPSSPERHTIELGADTGQVLELVRLALQPRVFIFLVEVVIMGAGMATVERLLFLYMLNDLEASTLLCGLSVGINVLFELPIFWYAEKCMKALGHDGMFILAMTCFVVRVYGYTLLSPATKWLILVLEVMHGVTFACFWIVCTDISKVLIHQTEGALWKTTIPSSVQMLYSALGVSIGSIMGGYTMNKFGSRVMYMCAAIVVGVTLILHILGSIGSRLLCNGDSLLPDFQTTTHEDPAEGEEAEALIEERVEAASAGSIDLS